MSDANRSRGVGRGGQREFETVTVVIPARNEGARVAATVATLASRAVDASRLDVVVVDDASEPGSEAVAAVAGLDVTIVRSADRLGVPRARNLGVARARGDVLFMTDAHVEVSRGWDEVILEHAAAKTILVGTVVDPTSTFRAYGCDLVVPFMGTRWRRERLERGAVIQIAPCPATVLPRILFEELGGYDAGMRLYSAAEPEFSVRAWLAGAQIIALPELEVSHRFKLRDEVNEFIEELRPAMVHNSLRFGFLYLSERAVLQMLRYYAIAQPDHFAMAAAMVETSDVWMRRHDLHRTLARDFDWFVDRFALRDQEGGEILR